MSSEGDNEIDNANASEENEEESDDDFNYEEELEFDSGSEPDETQSEDLDATLRSLEKLSYMLGKGKQGTDAAVTRKPEVADDFVRNFLIRMGMTKTVATFETEWYQIREKKRILDSQIGLVPDEYVRSMKQDEIVTSLQHQLKQANLLAQYRHEMLEKLRRERNVHRMHHRRIAQEKNRLIVDVKRLRKHYAQYEPIIRELKKKYDTLMRTKSMIALERDRLQALLAASESGSESSYGTGTVSSKAKSAKDLAARSSSMSGQIYRAADPLSIPRAVSAISQEPTIVKTFVLQKTFKGHTMPISNVVLHPKKPVGVTASDDSTWQMWGLPAGDLIMTGDGHKSWVAGIDFHPNGMQLSSSSGDCTVKVWSFEKACCIHTFSDHTQAVWGVSYHNSGEVLASASMDHTARIWDLVSMKCRGTLRGHVDSVNGCIWQPYNSILCTASSDKTVSLWDARSSLCVQTFYGHQSSCNHAAFDPKGETVVSVDANGIVKIWDIRKVAEYATIDVGPHPANKCAVDKSGYVVAIASSDSTIKCFQTYGEVVPIREFQGHTDAVQAVVFDRAGKYMVSAGSDCTFRIWGP
ncbi:flagellar WD repeat-containing protein Pf20 isoform X1 [Selaginella moellendorffii]|uniref:flagellar WD repeat-containing protein Pf20 isoform X1 n=1 Tax=Selaginella moellendorffii TaxID=88036 RepID=UPI000D1C254A|nr:flagellar WD repeat-containing protein Pf20 isoform X1 [Selaginella moellendorffii]XP_024516568.1 flagellar WD repeat-containing protein Pf20 isoform X1 [Selaginella moellendorffii]XP_024516569.1 flagellar WD repeat-containing protein Pf20 isoform X1 [Selaginella moellendorffii]|eukprot:XP_024516566.1 flagellar WD repeat-containing protein Pf20 isoform X1 [Selaginella moellendorffii]